MIKFDKKTHTYSDERGPLSGVTSLLQDAGLIDFSMIPEAMRGHYMDRGSKVHLAIELFDERDLDPESVDPVIAGYLDAYVNFVDEYEGRYKIIKSEQMVFHKTQRYAGRYDRLCIIDDELAILDIKTGGLQPWTALQLEAYRQAHEIMGGDKIQARYALQLSKDGKFNLKKYQDQSDAATWLAVVALARWKQKNN